jgi:hypothetical protein
MSELLPYSAISTLQSSLLLRQYEIPVTHAVSLPLPTLRAHAPGYVSFAAPAHRAPGQPQLQDAPDRWWIYSATSGQLIAYNLCVANPFAEGLIFNQQQLPKPAMSLEALKELQASVTSLMELLAGQFFAEQSGDTALRKRLLELLTALIPGALQPVYRAVAPDFFSWLEA